MQSPIKEPCVLPKEAAFKIHYQMLVAWLELFCLASGAIIVLRTIFSALRIAASDDFSAMAFTNEPPKFSISIYRRIRRPIHERPNHFLFVMGTFLDGLRVMGVSFNGCLLDEWYAGTSFRKDRFQGD